MKYWIKERDNPQIGVYFVPCGQLATEKARRMEDTLYGTNTMHSFDTKGQYLKRLEELREAGTHINE